MLWLGRGIFIPLLFAIFVWYLMNAMATYYAKVMPDKKIYKFIARILSLATFFGLIYLFTTQIRPMLAEFALRLPEIQTSLAALGDYLSGYFGLSFSADMLPNLTGIAAVIGTSLAGIATSAGMVVVYVFFMFIEQSTFNKKFAALFPGKTESKKMRYIVDSIDTNMKKYLFMKTFMAAVSAVASYAWLMYLDLPFAGIWAFIVFVTSYIPTIGAIVSSILPIIFAFVVATSFSLPILVATGLIAIQIVFGNIIEPKLTGKTLNLSTLAILINLVFWGMIWGAAGMFFSVPLLVATFIITAQFDSTRPIAILLSADGNIPDKREE